MRFIIIPFLLYFFSPPHMRFAGITLDSTIKDNFSYGHVMVLGVLGIAIIKFEIL